MEAPVSDAGALPDRIIDEKELVTLVPYSARQIRRLEQDGKFPARVRLGTNRVGWWLSEVMTWAKALPRGTSTPEAA